jgi:hypothetical protein
MCEVYLSCEKTVKSNHLMVVGPVWLGTGEALNASEPRSGPGLCENPKGAYGNLWRLIL